jgi:CRP-like cAMP-binding protein
MQRPQSSQTPRRSATVFALAPAQTLALAGSAFTALRNAHPSVEHLVVAALAHRVDQLSKRPLEALYIGVDRRVYLRLIELADRKPPSDTVIPLSTAISRQWPARLGRRSIRCSRSLCLDTIR